MDEGQAGAASSSGAAGESDLQGPSASGQAEQQEQGQEQGQAQQLAPPIAGARNYGYPDDVMMYAFKVEVCTRTDKHPRGSCPYAHPGDVARRRHPSRYQALLCPEVRAKKVCPRLDECQCSHSAFEFWLHPDRYRTSMCEKGARCSRPVCFFAHTAEELRPLPAGLKPAAPDDAAAGTSSSSKRGGGSSSAGSGIWQAPGGGMLGQMHPACMSAGLSGGVRYVQQQAAQPQQHMVPQPGMQLVPVAAAGAAVSGGYSPVGYLPVQMQPAVDGSLVQQPATQYGQAPGRFYAPAAVAEQQQVQRGAGPVLVMPAGPQQQQYVVQPAAVHQKAQLPEVMQQFQGLLVSSAPMTLQHQQQQQQYTHFGSAAAATPAGQWQHAGSHQQQGHEQQQMVMLMQPGASGPQAQQQAPYMLQQPSQIVYMQGPAEPESWSQGSQQQQQLHQQQKHQQYMYGAGYSPAAAASSSGGYQRAYGHHAHVQPYSHARHQHASSGPHSSGGSGMLPHSAAPTSTGMHVPIAVPVAAGGQPAPPPGSTDSAGLVLGAPLLHQGSQQLAAPAAAAAAAVVIDAGSLGAAGQHVSLMHQPGGMVTVGQTASGAVGRVLTGHAGLGLNVPGGGVQGQHSDRAGW